MTDSYADFAPPAPPDGGDAARAALIAQLVATCTGVAARDISSRGRSDYTAARARHVAMYLAHTGFSWSLTRVGQAFGRDRTTAGHACAMVEDRRDDERFDATLAAMEDCLRAAPPRLEGWL